MRSVIHFFATLVILAVAVYVFTFASNAVEGVIPGLAWTHLFLLVAILSVSAIPAYYEFFTKDGWRYGVYVGVLAIIFTGCSCIIADLGIQLVPIFAHIIGPAGILIGILAVVQSYAKLGSLLDNLLQ